MISMMKYSGAARAAGKGAVNMKSHAPAIAGQAGAMGSMMSSHHGTPFFGSMAGLHKNNAAVIQMNGGGYNRMMNKPSSITQVGPLSKMANTATIRVGKYGTPSVPQSKDRALAKLL